MAGSKHRTKFRRARSRKGFCGTPAWSKETTPSATETSSRDVAMVLDQTASTPSLSNAGEANSIPLDDSGELVSMSRRKLLNPDDDPESVNEVACTDNGYRLIHLDSLSAVASKIHNCQEENLLIKEQLSSRAGLMSNVDFHCGECLTTEQLQTSPSITRTGRSFDVNRRAAYYALESGNGYSGLSKFCCIMNMPCMTMRAYQKQVDIMLAAQEEEGLSELIKSGKSLRSAVLEEEQSADLGQVVDVAVSFDGTWARRGFSSLFGVVFAISVDSGEVLDYEVMSKACSKCSAQQSRCEDSDTFDEWKAEHVSAGLCDINFSGSSPAMEAEGAAILWKRSIEKHSLRYKWMVSDGDSKAFASVRNIYEDCEVVKLDCVGHVQKPNESINSVVWAQCPKHLYHGAKVVRFAAAAAVCHFCSGSKSKLAVMERLDIAGGIHSEAFARAKDQKRIAKADNRCSQRNKKRRQGLLLRRTLREEALRETEGVTYEAGAF